MEIFKISIKTFNSKKFICGSLPVLKNHFLSHLKSGSDQNHFAAWEINTNPNSITDLINQLNHSSWNLISLNPNQPIFSN
jgi:hypothetical protein